MTHTLLPRFEKTPQLFCHHKLTDSRQFPAYNFVIYELPFFHDRVKMSTSCYHQNFLCHIFKICALMKFSFIL